MWIRPQVHPCQKCHDIPENEVQSDYVDLLNMVKRQTCCSTNYCLRNKSDESELKCRFHFPFDHCDQTKLEFEKNHSKGDNPQYRAKVVTKKIDSRTTVTFKLLFITMLVLFITMLLKVNQGHLC